MTRLVIWRHGRTEWNASDRTQGHTDVDLDDAGVAQAAEVAPRLAAYRPDLIVSSDLRRAARTAEALAAVTGLSVELDVRLRERYFGPWQGLTNAEIRQRYPDQHAQLGSAAPIVDLDIETIDDMAKRVGAAFRDVAERVTPDGTAVVVTHGGTARVGCGTLLGLPQGVWHTLGGLGNCRHSELRHTPVRGWQLITHNLP
jgi:glucosyl-3-phosphoglycerate phosphatase